MAPDPHRSSITDNVHEERCGNPWLARMFIDIAPYSVRSKTSLNMEITEKISGIEESIFSY